MYEGDTTPGINVSRPERIYLHSHDIFVLPTITSSFVSIATRAASQYSVSVPSEITPPPISVVTCLQILHVPSDSQEVKAQDMIINAIQNMSLRFI
jgi:hypothetical protein